MSTHAAVITGASRGIGRAAAKLFAENGYNLCISSHNSKEELLDFAKDLMVKYGIQVLAYSGDMGNNDYVVEMFEKYDKICPKLDVLINNAGISQVGLFTEESPGAWEEILRSNLSSAFYCSQQAAKRMIHNKEGKICNISSVWGAIGASCEVAYSATKGGLNAMTKAMAKELAPSNIQVNAIACGAIDTTMNEFLSEDERKALEAEIPAGRMGTPIEVANHIWDLCQMGSYLTGQVIALDGGWI